MHTTLVFVVCLLVSVSAIRYDNGLEEKSESEERTWHPDFNIFEDRSKPTKIKKEKDNKLFQFQPYYPGFYPYPIYIMDGYYLRPSFIGTDLSYLLRKETKDKPVFKP